MIELRNVTKQYKHTKAIDGIQLELSEPGIYCLLGRNGAGKTTLMKLLAGHIQASSGEVMVNGQRVTNFKMPTAVHFVASDAVQYNVRLKELFKMAGKLAEGFDTQLALSLAQGFQLDVSKKYRQLSFGRKAMVNTILGLASAESILLLDEPVLGFDAIMRKTFYDMLVQSYRENPKTIIVSTHLIDEIAGIAETLVMIDQGRLLMCAEIEQILENSYHITGPTEKVLDATDGLHVIAEIQTGGFTTRSIFDKRIEPCDGCTISALSLQDFFVNMVGEEGKGLSK